jgi:uncharacterized protein YbjT (DUF2867 family)
VDERFGAGPETPCYRGRDWNGRRIRSSIRARPPRRWKRDFNWAQEARHLASQAERGSASKLRRQSALAEELSGQEAAVFCLGTYTGTVPDAELRKITVDYTIEFARVLRLSNPDAAFSFLSGNGADPTGRSRIPYARHKGEAEKALLAEGFPRVYIFRPAYIYPVEPRKEPNFSYRLLRAIYPVFRVLFPNQVIRADDLARAMVDVALRRTGERGGLVFENRDIRAMAESLHTPATYYRR